MNTVAVDELEEGVSAPDSDMESDEPEMESSLHLMQLFLLLECLELYWKERKDFFAAGNMSIYYSERQWNSEQQSKSDHFRGPDFFVVLGTERRPRKSWCVWREDGQYPHLIVEVLSKGTSPLDRGLKKQIYQDIFRTPDYFWFDPITKEFAGFHLIDGQYEPLAKDEQGRMPSAQLGLLLGVHEGMLRFYTEQGELLPSGRDLAERNTELAEHNTELAERNEKLMAKLREMGIDPEALDNTR